MPACTRPSTIRPNRASEIQGEIKDEIDLIGYNPARLVAAGMDTKAGIQRNIAIGNPSTAHPTG